MKYNIANDIWLAISWTWEIANDSSLAISVR